MTAFQAYPGRRRGYRVMQVTNDYILTVDDEVVQITGSVTITLPDAGLAAGRVYRITCQSGNSVIQDATGNVLDSTVGARRYQSDGSNWHEVRGAQRCYIQDDTPANAMVGDLWTNLT